MEAMDTAARMEAAMARLEAGKAVALNATKAGPPCLGCRFYIKERRGEPRRPGEAIDAYRGRANEAICAHLAYSEQVFNPVTGELKEAVQIQAAQARREDGLCGPEALLFEPRQGLQAVRDKVSSAWDKGSLFFGGIAVGFYLTATLAIVFRG